MFYHSFMETGAIFLGVEVIIRQIKQEDVNQIKRIIDLSFPRFFRFFARKSLDSEKGKVLVVEAQGTVFGFAKLIEFNVNRVKYGCILWLAVHPDHRRQGTASNLVKAGNENLMQSGVGAVFASVQRRNRSSLATFSKCAFVRIGFWGLWRLFKWRIFEFYREIWYAPSEIVLMYIHKKQDWSGEQDLNLRRLGICGLDRLE
jgi:N-acetylglutamate synthase-like GNAT family acetyltransferase